MTGIEEKNKEAPFQTVLAWRGCKAVGGKGTLPGSAKYSLGDKVCKTGDVKG